MFAIHFYLMIPPAVKDTLLKKYPSILYCGNNRKNWNSERRGIAFEKNGHKVDWFNFADYINVRSLKGKVLRRLGWDYSINTLNEALFSKSKQLKPSIIWIDKGLNINGKTLKNIKSILPNTIIAHYNPDDPFNNKKQYIWKTFKAAIPFYDIHFVPDAHKIEDYKKAGASNVFDYDRSFDFVRHKPLELCREDKTKYHTEVGFIGTCAPARAESIAYLIKNGINVSVIGGGWDKSIYWQTIKPHFKMNAVFGEEYTKAINGMEIALHFLRRENRDEQDSRSYEIPACGVCMIAERSPKHEEIFEENKEAIFFDSNEELLDKVKYFLSNKEEAKAIGRAARKRCLESGYDHNNRLFQLLDIIDKNLS